MGVNIRLMLGKARRNHSSCSKNEFGGAKVGIYRPIEVEAVPHAQQQFGLSWFLHVCMTSTASDTGCLGHAASGSGLALTMLWVASPPATPLAS